VVGFLTLSGPFSCSGGASSARGSWTFLAAGRACERPAPRVRFQSGSNPTSSTDPPGASPGPPRTDEAGGAKDVLEHAFETAEAIYNDMPRPIGLQGFAPEAVTRGPMFGAPKRAGRAGESVGPPPGRGVAARRAFL